MNRVLTAFVTAVAIMASPSLVSTAEIVNPTPPVLRQVSDPARQQGLSVGFAEISGAFLADVTVVIEDRSGKELVNTVVDGPWLFAPLPAGVYNVKAVFDDQLKQMKNVRLRENEVTMMVMYWDLNVPGTQMLARLER
jgi:hypothetical protein